MKNQINLGILGAGNIASVVSKAISTSIQINKYAVASRTLEKAQLFKEKYGFSKAFGSYLELLEDENVDLVYIATPHSFHYEQMLMCIEHKKNILCEKAFCLTKGQAQEVIDKAIANQVFVCEALCTAFLPTRKIINDLLKSKIIGEIRSYYGVFGAKLLHVKRVIEKELGGGALLDIGIYPLYFCLSTFGYDCKIKDVKMKMYHEVDESEVVTLEYPNGISCVVEASASEDLGLYCDIYGTNGKIHIENVARPEFIEIYDSNDILIKRLDNLRNTTGYEYEFLACFHAINNHQLETKEMTHEETLNLLGFMDKIREFINI